jgi:Fis family transcriptional regulator, factor for inversion stimulation protein
MNDRFTPLVEYVLDGGLFLEETIELLERALIEGALLRAGGNQSAASKALGIHRNTMKRKIAEYGLKTSRQRRKPVSRTARILAAQKSSAS